MTRVGVVGAGILGLAVARRLASAGAEVTVLDKEAAVAAHQTGHNSGVAHAGLYYAPGSLKARLCRRGIGLLKEYCAERGLPYEECGKVVVARHEGEVPRLREIQRRATENGVPGLRWLDAAGLREVEPHAAGVAALHSPHTAIVDFAAVARAFADDVAKTGGTIRLGYEVVRI
ncbi:MAG TPA: FAD-dependent oxidoreductase, partial [Thermomonospora sp.]|nr:FAD-dependent oxidoreductase [Thermomonospora sp.]